MMLATIAISVLFTLAFYRVILAILRAVMFVGVTYVFLRGMALAYTLDYPTIGGVFVGGVIGFLVVGVLCGAFIRHALIRHYLQRAIERDRQSAQAGKLW